MSSLRRSLISKGAVAVQGMQRIRSKAQRSAAAMARGETGVVAVEFALIAPLMIAILAGVVAFGIYFGTAHSVQQLAADAARASVGGMSDDERASLARNRVAKSVGSYPLLDPGRAVVTAARSPGDPNLFEVAVRYDASGLGIWTFEHLIPLPSRTIVRSSIIQRGGY